MKKEMKLSIKGVKYNLKIVPTFFYDGEVCCDGICEKFKKNIKVAYDDDFRKFSSSILHELLHAYLFECGLIEESNDESLVEWMEIQFPYIMGSLLQVLFRTFDREECLTSLLKLFYNW